MKLRLFGLMVGLIGQFLILSLFLWVIPVEIFGNDSILWLDFGVVSIVYWLWMIGSILFKLDTKEESQKVFGALGITIFGTLIYSLLALGFAVVCILIWKGGNSLVAFSWQIEVQGCILFIFLFYCLMAAHAANQTEQVYYEEKHKKAGKQGVKTALQQLLFVAECNHSPAHLLDRIRTLQNETRFIAPSTDPEAQQLDSRIETDCESAALAFRNFDMNREHIEELIKVLELNISRRKQY